jgi:Domain of unknown function (DUF4352)
MKLVVKVLEWLVLLPLWRSIFKPRWLQTGFAVGTGILWLVILVALGAAGDRGRDASSTESSSANQAQALPGAAAEAEHVRVVLHEIADPWAPEGLFQQPPEGRRLVAFDITIEFFDNDGTHGANPFNFRLTDANDFAYAEALRGPEPRLETVALGSGQKTRGWIAFEVESSAPLKLLEYDPNAFTKRDIEFEFK